MGKSKHAEKHPLLSAVAGGITGAIEISLTYPTEYIKTVMQLYPETNKKGTLTNFVETIRNKGFFGLYKGYSALLLFSVPKNYVRFGSNMFAKKEIFKGNESKTAVFVSGLFAGASEAVFVVTPQETIKTKLIHDILSPAPKYRGIFHGIYNIVKSKGIRGIYKGVFPTLLKQSTNQGVRFLVQAESKKMIKNYIDNNVVCDFLGGFIAGVTSVMVNNPLDCVKTQMQGLKADKYKGMFDCFYQIMKHEGPMGFYKGVTPRLLRVSFDVGITFTIFNQLNDIIIENYLNWRGIKE